MATVFNKAFNGVGVVCKATVRNNGNCYCTKLPKVVNDVIVNNLEYYNTYAPALLTMVIVNNAVAFSHQPLLSTIAVAVLKGVVRKA